MERYTAHLNLKSFDKSSQAKILKASVTVVGAGGLGSVVATYLVAAGVGRLTIIDDDLVESSNLVRQTLYSEADIGEYKADTAKKRLLSMNSSVNITSIHTRLSASNADELLNQSEFVADCSDNFKTRFTINEACFRADNILVSAAAEGYGGFVTSFAHTKTSSSPCYRCFHPNLSQNSAERSCSRQGILNSVCGIIGSIQATELIKQITGMQNNLIGKMLTIDIETYAFRSAILKKNGNCPTCSSQHEM